jgi:AraC-like DNA-binding protein
MGLITLIKKKSIIISWLISYVSILLIPIIISGLMYSETRKTVEDQINSSNKFALKRIQQHIDGLLGDIDRVSTEICFSTSIREVLDNMDTDEESFRYGLFKIRQQIKLYALVNSKFDDIFIYFKDKDTVLTTNTAADSREYFELNINKDASQYDKWLSIINSKHKGDYIVFTEEIGDGGSHKNIAFIRSIPLFRQDVLVNLVITVDQSKFVDEVGGLDIVNEGTAFIIDNSNTIVASSIKNDNFNDLLSYDKLDGVEGLFYDDISGKKMAVSFIGSKVNSWKYVSMVPSKVFREKAEYVGKVTFLSILLCLAFGGLVSIFFLRKNYKPIGDLVEHFRNNFNFNYEKQDNEFCYIKEAFDMALDEKSKIDIKLSEQKLGLRMNFLSRLLKGYEGKGIETKNLLSEYEISFESDFFLVVVFYIKSMGAASIQNDNVQVNDYVKLIQFAIRNVVEELVGKKNKGYMLEVDGLMTCLINLKVDNVKNNWIEEVNSTVSEACRFLYEHFGLELMPAISNLHETIMGIPQAYAEAVELIEYRNVTGNENIINYENITKVQKEDYYYPLEKEYQLLNCMRAGDFEGVTIILDEIFKRNLDEKTPSMQIVRCLMFDLVSSMIKTVNVITDIYRNNFLEELRPVEVLLGCKNIPQMKEKMLDLAQRICKYVSEHQEKANYNVRDKAINYIKNNYNDISLGNTSVAEYLGMNPNYLSTVFKNQTGEGLSDYINSVRINEAKKLLSTDKYTIEDVAKAVGYTSSHTFIRVFKKYEGLTPGKYKESCANNGSDTIN